MNNVDERHVLGLPEMDAQHTYLYGLFDMLGSDAVSVDRRRLENLMAELERYLHFHFTSEEHLMRSYSYPGFGGHQSDHETAGNRFVQFLDEFDAGKLNPAALRIFLTGWLMEHSRTADADYTDWILRCRSDAGISAA